MQRTSQAEYRWLPGLLALTAASLFLLLHPYRGLVHDGRLYTLQALDKVFPRLYDNDVFLRFGSQDDFTLFSSLHAWAIRLLGVETAAAILTLASILLFLVGAYLLARTLSTPLQAWFSLLLLLVIPAYYGPNYVFHYIEEFVTPRQLAGALIVFSLWAWLRNHRVLGIALASGATVMHPIIALPGVLLLATIDWIVSKWRSLWPLAIVAVALATAATLGWIPISRWQFDPEWRDLALSRAYLSLTNWELVDWSRVVTVGATLIAAALILEWRQRQLSVAALVTCGGMLLLALIGGDFLHLVVVVQAQPWRALWFATFLAVILLPPVWMILWRRNGIHRCAALLLGASWASPDPAFGLGLAPLALLALCGAESQTANQNQRVILAGAWLVATIIVVYSIADGLLALEGGLTRVDSVPPVLDRLATASVGGVVPLLFVLAGHVALRLWTTAAAATLTIGMAGLAVTLCLVSGRPWANAEYPQQMRDAFSHWRELVPVGSDVLWLADDTDVGQSAFHTWFILQRPSFISRTQASNALFSRRAAIEMKHRDESLQGRVPMLPLFVEEAPELQRPLRLDPICRHSSVRYLVSAEPFADAQGISLPPSAGKSFIDYRLYICP